MEGAGIPGLVSLRFAGAGVPRSLQDMMQGEAPPGSAPRSRPGQRATAVEGSARGSGPWGPPGGPRVGGDGGGRGEDEGSRGLWGGVGEEPRSGVWRGVWRQLGAWAGVPGELRTSPPLTVADPQGFFVGGDF